MTVSLKHTAVAVGVEAGNGEIGKDEWNDEHVLSLATGKLVGRTTAGDGAAEEISVDSTLTLAAGSLGLSSATLGAYVEVAGDTMTGSLTMDSGTNIALTNTTNANQFGVVTKGGTRFLHNFNYGDNGTVTTQGNNLFIGEFAGNLTTGSTATVATNSSRNTAVGYAACSFVTTGFDNAAFGASSLNNLTSGDDNVSIGSNAGTSLTTGSSNMFIGPAAGQLNTTSSSNTAVGRNSLYAANSGNNVAIGGSAGFNYTGNNMTAIGVQALYGNTSGVRNIAIGNYAIQGVTTGEYNIGIGYSAGNGITTGSGNTIIGSGGSALSSSLTNNIILATSAATGVIRAQFDGNDWWFSGSIGYATGQGGTVTQETSRTTGVTINKNCGAITLVSAAGSTSWQSFTVTNSEVAATDTIIVNQKSGTDKNMIHVTAVGAGSFEITFATTGGTTTEQPVFNFSVLKAVAA